MTYKTVQVIPGLKVSSVLTAVCKLHLIVSCNTDKQFIISVRIAPRNHDRGLHTLGISKKLLETVH